MKNIKLILIHKKLKKKKNDTFLTQEAENSIIIIFIIT